MYENKSSILWKNTKEYGRIQKNMEEYKRIWKNTKEYRRIRKTKVENGWIIDMDR